MNTHNRPVVVTNASSSVRNALTFKVGKVSVPGSAFGITEPVSLEGLEVGLEFNAPESYLRFITEEMVPQIAQLMGIETQRAASTTAEVFEDTDAYQRKLDEHLAQADDAQMGVDLDLGEVVYDLAHEKAVRTVRLPEDDGVYRVSAFRDTGVHEQVRRHLRPLTPLERKLLSV